MQTSTPHDDFARLSNDDIRTVHAIVEAASRVNPNPPYTKTLFDAWQQFVDDKSISPSDGNRYFTVIARMARPGNAAGVRSLFELFQKTLGAGGIIVDFDEEVVDENVTYDIKAEDLEHDSEAESGPLRPISRRASFDSVYDTLHEDIDANLDEPPPAYSALALRQKRSTSRATDPGSESQAHPVERTNLHTSLPIRGRPGGRAASDQMAINHRRSRSTSSQGSIRITRPSRAIRRTNDPSAEVSEDSTSHSSGTEASASIRVSTVPRSAIETFRQSDTQLLADADTFLTYRTRLTARRALHSWHDRVLTAHAYRNQLIGTACTYDRVVLLRSAFRAWFDLWQERRSVRHTEQYWAQRERLATKLRDEHLVYKAFSHWAQHAADQVMRTSVARRHVLRTKYFNAWRDVTAVNQLKIRQHALKKFFGTWRKRYTQIDLRKVSAMSSSEDRLLSEAFSAWRHRVAEQWMCREYEMSRLQERKKPVFEKWLDITRNIINRETSVLRMRDNLMKRNCIHGWSGQAQKMLLLKQEAESFRRQHLLTTSFRYLKTEAVLHPPAVRLRQGENSRVKRSALLTLSERAVQHSLARRLDNQRILRTTFTAWNDQLRVLALSIQLDSRARREMFHRWQIAARSARYAREQKAKLKSQHLSCWAASTNTNRHARQAAERIFEVTQDTLRLRAGLSKVRNRIRVLQIQQSQAAILQTPRLKTQYLTKWRDRTATLHILDTQADAARFYVLATHTIKAWNEATYEHQRARRREAYAVVRRSHKINLVRKLFNNWSERSTIIQAQNRIAVGRLEDHVFQLAQLSLRKWRDASHSLLSQAKEANALIEHKLQLTGWRMLASGYARNNAMNIQASILQGEVIHAQLDTCLRKLNWRLFELQRLQHSAKSLEERNFKKHVRNVLRYWAECTFRRRLSREHRETNNDDADNHGPHDDESQDHEKQVGPSPKDNEQSIQGFGDPNANRSPRRSFAWGTYTPRSDWRTAFDASAFDLRPLDLEFDVKALPATSSPPESGLNAQDRRREITSTPLPGYLRTPSKRSTVRKARELATLGHELASTTPAGPPPSMTNLKPALTDGIAIRPLVEPRTASRPSELFTAATPASFVSSFETKLRAQGYSAPRLGTNMARNLKNAKIPPATTGKPRAKERRTVGFVGFEELAKHS